MHAARRAREAWRGLALALLLAARSAHASGDRPKAEAEFAEGVRLFQLGDYEGARAAFLRADAEVHSPTITFNLARAEEKLGDVQAAVAGYEAYLREAGTGGELGLAATVAAAEIRARSARLRVETEPPGGIVEIDGRVQRERAPETFLLRPGVHRVRVSGSGFDEAHVVDASAPGREIDLHVVASKANEPSEAELAQGLFAGAGVALVPYHFFGLPKSPDATRFADHTNVTLGIAIEAGVPVVQRLFLTGDLFGAVGTYGHPNFVVGGGVGLAYRFDFGLWARAAATIADVDNAKDGRHLSTDVVLGPSVEMAYEIARGPRFAWIVAAGACYLPADALRDNDAIFFPVRIALRSR